ncbi:hypothetical protein AAFF_G00028410 [Aldrovandia affinis]|uniref:Uncharacterized protein n=1 Tax=Aldrovandia affinis TaxID=143900 RepID=A0AAD7S4F6_9TELE|nr:hypothetical protein AAFF_G00028410 [Aldrovandia affinis]
MSHTDKWLEERGNRWTISVSREEGDRVPARGHGACGGNEGAGRMLEGGRGLKPARTANKLLRERWAAASPLPSPGPRSAASYGKAEHLGPVRGRPDRLSSRTRTRACTEILHAESAGLLWHDRNSAPSTRLPA